MGGLDEIVVCEKPWVLWVLNSNPPTHQTAKRRKLGLNMLKRGLLPSPSCFALVQNRGPSKLTSGTVKMVPKRAQLRTLFGSNRRNSFLFAGSATRSKRSLPPFATCLPNLVVNHISGPGADRTIRMWRLVGEDGHLCFAAAT